MSGFQPWMFKITKQYIWNKFSVTILNLKNCCKIHHNLKSLFSNKIDWTPAVLFEVEVPFQIKILINFRCNLIFLTSYVYPEHKLKSMKKFNYVNPEQTLFFILICKSQIIKATKLTSKMAISIDKVDNLTSKTPANNVMDAQNYLQFP